MIGGNMYGSMFASLFNFAAKTQQLIEQSRASIGTCPSFVNIFSSLTILSDSSISALGAYLGIKNLTELLFESEELWAKTLIFILNILMCASYVFITFGMARNGSEKTIAWLGDCVAITNAQYNKNQYDVDKSSQNNNDTTDPLLETSSNSIDYDTENPASLTFANRFYSAPLPSLIPLDDASQEILSTQLQ